MRFYLMSVAALAACSPETTFENALAGNALALHVSAVGANGDDATTVPLQGSRPEQIAQIFQRILDMGDVRTWEAARAVFPGARWDERRSETAALAINAVDARVLAGTIDLAGADYDIGILGTTDRVSSIGFNAPPGTLVTRAHVDRALANLELRRELIGCLGASFGYYQLMAGERSIVFADWVSREPRVGSADGYAFQLDDPMSGNQPSDLDRGCA